ncbi:SNF2 family N-terminal domain-containing protein [Hyaloraphidium curvatum]|nr:SNF2 family N-terminal domain-containing protein [Hyaloraphidium curvatum]
MDDEDQIMEDDDMSGVERFAYLTGQSELFTHFINLRNERKGAKKIDIPLSPTSKAANKDAWVEDECARYLAPNVSHFRADRRHRKTEKEEDEELLQKEEETVNATVITESPSYVKGGKMRDYQIQGLNWLISLYDNGINGILADEMGLGKTLQTISFLGYLKVFRGNSGPHLVIVPKSTLHNWMNEFAKWVPDLKVFMFHGSKEERAVQARDQLLPGGFDVCVTSYEICLLEKAHFKKFAWSYIVIDEAHRIKNENSMLAQIVRLFQSRNRLLITGTPLQNNLHELWALLNFLLPDVFSSSEDFDSWFRLQGGDQDKVVQQLQKVLQPFLLRRIKSDVEKSLLPKKRQNLYVGMSAMQRKWYKQILEKDIDAVNGAVGNDRTSKTRLLNVVMQLRKCCNHPYLFDGAEPGPPYTTDQHLVDNAGKMILLDKLLARLKANGSRVLLFSQMSRVLDILEDYCLWKKYQYCRIDGNTAHEDRINAIDEYNKPGSEKFIFLLTTRAGGLGINLATADIVIMYDSDWHAEDRAHRIGQTKQVIVFRFITENAIEEKVIERATQKLKLDQLVIQQGKATQQSKAASKDELLAMIQHGADTVFKGAESTVVDEDIEQILQKGAEKTAELDAKFADAGIEDLQRFTLNTSTMVWEGEDYSAKRKADQIGLNWIGPAKRERKNEKINYSMDDYYRETLRPGAKPTAPKGPRVQKYPLVSDFQFFPPRFLELQRKEMYHFRQSAGQKVAKGEEPSELDEEAKEKWRADEQLKIDEAEPLTEEERAEMEELSTQGFGTWSRKDFQAFIKANEKFGRTNLQAIAADLVRPLDEVTKYSEVFWERYKEIQDHQKHLAKIEEGEREMRKQDDTRRLLAEKVAQYRQPLQELEIHYNQNKGKNWTEDEDRFLLVTLDKLGYGPDDVYDKLRVELRDHRPFKFDWFIKARTTANDDDEEAPVARKATTATKKRGRGK